MDKPPGPVIASLDDVADQIKSGMCCFISPDQGSSMTAKNVIVLVGAGVSVSAGIPDFRSPETGQVAVLS